MKQNLLNFVNSLNYKLNKEYILSEDKLAIYRLFYCLMLFWLIGIENVSLYGTVSEKLYEPIFGLPMLFSGAPSKLIFTLLNYLNLFSLVCLLVGWRTKYSSLAFGLSTIIIKSFVEGYLPGYGRHIIYDFVPVLMAFSGWGNKFSLDELSGRKDSVSAVPLFYLAFLLCFAIFSAGVPKLISGWLSTRDQAVYWHIVNKYFQRNADLFFIPYIVEFGQTKFWEMIDFIVVGFEITIIGSFLYRKILVIFLSLLIAFHFSVVLSLNIGFFSISSIYLVFLLYYLNIDFLKNTLKKLFSSRKVFYAIACMHIGLALSYFDQVSFHRVGFLRSLPLLLDKELDVGIPSLYFTSSVWLSFFLWLSYTCLIPSVLKKMFFSKEMRINSDN